MTIPLVERAEHHTARLAISAVDGEHTYGDLLASSARVASGLLEESDPAAAEAAWDTWKQAEPARFLPKDGAGSADTTTTTL